MRQMLFLILIALFCLPVLAQDDEPLLFAYVAPENNFSHDTFIMDARTGSIVSSYTNVGNDCITPFVNDSRWLILGQMDGNFIYDLDNNLVFSGSDEPANRALWTPDKRLVAYHHAYNGLNNLSVVEFDSNREVYYVSLPLVYVYQTDFVFVGESLVYATISEAGILDVYSWDGTETKSKTFENESYASLTAIKISPNGRYALGYTLTEVYLISLETGAIQLLGTGYFSFYGYDAFESSVQWLPEAEASFLYLTPDNTGESQIVDAESPNSDAFMSDYGFRLSPDNAYLVYGEKEDVSSPTMTLWLVNRSTGDTQMISSLAAYSGDIQWLSATQFVYTYADVEAENFSPRDIYFYDIATGENRQLSDTPDIDESFECNLG